MGVSSKTPVVILSNAKDLSLKFAAKMGFKILRCAQNDNYYKAFKFSRTLNGYMGVLLVLRHIST